MVKLSVVMITQNAERLLDQVLAKASQVADEIIVVDSGSTDQTLAIAKRYTSIVVEQPWLGFGLQKQKAVNLASGDWILALDADEVLDDELSQSLIALKNSNFEGREVAYEISRPLVFAGKIIRRSISLWTVRLFKKGWGQFTDQAVHERLVIQGQIGRIQRGELLHYSYASVSDWVSRMNLYTDLSIQQKTQKKVSVSFAVLSGLVIFLRLYLLKGGFLEGRMGFVFAFNWGLSNYLKYLKLALRDEFKGPA